MKKRKEYRRLRLDSGQHRRIKIAAAIFGLLAFVPVALRLYQLMVTDYEVIEGDRTPGSSFLLEMHIANLSRTAWAYDVVATLTVENLSVSLQEGVTNQLYFHEIAPMETIAVQFPMEVYTYSTEETEFYFADGETSMTIVLKAAD